VFDILKREMSEMKKEVGGAKQDVIEMKRKINDFETCLEYQSKELENKKMEDVSKMKSMSEKIDEMDKKLLLLEKQDRKYNLLFYGFPEEQNENIERKMKSFFIHKLELEEGTVQNMSFTHLHRVPNEGNGPNPIIVRFLSFGDRDLVLSKSLLPVLRQERKRILTDLPVIMKRERGRLAKIAYTIRQSEKLKTRIQERGLDVYLQVRKGKEDMWVTRKV
jgi:hypothetical protein